VAVVVDFCLRAVGTVIYRPYVFIFFTVYLVAAVSKMGWKKTTAFTLTAYLVAFAGEFSSTRNGFPFGLYHYIDDTRGRELWISNVPFWDSLSFSFLCYLGYALAVFVYSPLLVRDGDLQVVDTREIRLSWRVLVTATVLTTFVDVIVDPLTLQGEKWFLGKMYYYPGGGIYFGVPLANFLGWALVAFVTVFFFQLMESHLFTVPARYQAGVHRLRGGGLLEPGLYAAILGFNLAVTFYIGEYLLGIIGMLIYIPAVTLFLAHPLNPLRRATPADLAAHRRDFPLSPIA
jgi:putative membrane protein